MSVEVGSEITVDVEKAVAGGRMLARHEGRVALVWGAIPGERVRARIDRVTPGVLYAEVAEVLSSSPDRRPASADWRCGGSVFAHVAYERQRELKGEIVRDALERIGRVPLPAPPPVAGSPEQGYRMRARLHVRDGRLGFYREGTHELCDASSTGQLASATGEWIGEVEEIIARERLTGLAAIEMAENVRGDERACHLELQGGTDARAFRPLAAAGPLAGLSAARGDRGEIELLEGCPGVADVLHVRADDPASTLRLWRDVRAFFQANRFLLEPLARHVVSLLPPGPVVDLYAGVGLFGLAAAAAGIGPITLVEGDPVSAADLAANAEPFLDRVRVERRSVEGFLAAGPQSVGRVPPRGSPVRAAAPPTFIVDPPRTGMSKQALAGIVSAAPPRLLYVSCDVATLARDTRTLLDAGYTLDGLTGFDLFPNTAHVESVAVFRR
ncbi:MAG: hypothetical protein A3F70_14900 [Acidobacteria bacterium RIFCSPLOWO2_12_FULL_67_14]|nr:MAG: hypothetical protein A3F70_14900 [Acidobacteria bacterium RIFCSPLOWO2_12_FULL_67_14]